MGKLKSKKGITRNELLLIVAVIIIACITVIVVVVNKKSATTNNTDGVVNPTVTNESTKNYEELMDGTKNNISSKIKQVKKAGDLTITDTKILYTKGITSITAKVTNLGSSLDSLKFNIKLIATDGSVKKEIQGEIGSIKANEEKYLKTSITQDLTDVKDIIYEIK